jgi:hypothetical protein
VRDRDRERERMKGFLLVAGLVLVLISPAFCWSKEGHMMTCKIAQVKILGTFLFFFPLIKMEQAIRLLQANS